MTSLADNFGQNIVINPSFELGQRNILFPNITTSQYTLDRWNINLSGGQDVKVERILDSPLWSKNIYSLKLTNNLAVVNGVSSFTGIRQPIEGYNVRRIRGNDFVISFNIKSSIAGIYTIYFSNNGSTVRYNTPITVNQANVWEHKTVRINAINETLGTFLFDNSIGLDMQLVLQSGTGFPNVKDTWTNTAIIGNTGQVDFTATLGSTIQLNDVSIHSGIAEIPFENLDRNAIQEEVLCDRYYSYGGANNSKLADKHYRAQNYFVASPVVGYSGYTFNFLAEKRILPVVTNVSTNVDNAAGFTSYINTRSVMLVAHNLGNASHYAQFRCDWTADAEL